MTEDASGAGAVSLVASLGALGRSVATAESLTGGLVGAAITDVPGSSAVYRGGVVAYASDVKESVLGVPGDVIATHGVVSRECAEAMARGVRDLLGASYGVATTGVAGPGPQDGLAAGTVWIAVAGPGIADARLLALAGGRTDVRTASCAAAIRLIRDILHREVPGLG